MEPSFARDVRSAAEALRQVMQPTPLQENLFLGARHGARVFLKREDLSPVRSYKIRGAFTFFDRAIRAGRGDGPFVCASAGNHAQGFAYACRHFGRKGIIYMPVTTPSQKIDKTQRFGGEWIEIRLVGDFFDVCNRAALAFAAETGAIMAPPFDHEDIIAGQATVAAEVLAQMPDDMHPDIVIAPVGGGGLAAGMTRYFLEAGENARFILVEPAGAPSLQRSLMEGRRVKLGTVDNFVDGAAVAEIGALNFDYLKDRHPGDVVLAPENRICSTLLEMLNIEGVVLEPAGALAIDALKDFRPGELRGRTIVCIVSGGNFDFERLPDVKERSLRFEGLKKYFVLRLPQRPGALRDFLDMLGPEDDITRFEYLKKSARNFGSILIGIETRSVGNFAALFARFNDAGVSYQDITDNDLLAGLVV